MKTKWPNVRLGEVLTPIDRAEAPVPGKTYRQLGVKLWGEGAYERESIDGAATRYAAFSRVEADDIVVNKIWARNGSVAVVQPELAGCFVSSEFPTFTASPERLLPRWMHWLTKTAPFWSQCDEKSQGTSGKNRIKPEQFLKVEIPLPPLPEQRRIVARIEVLAAQVAEARRLRHQAAEETEALMDSATNETFSKSSLKQFRTPLGNADLAVNAESRDPFRNDPKGSFSYVDISSVKRGPSVINSAQVLPTSEAPSRARRVMRAGDIIFSTVRPNLRAIAKVGDALDNQICSTGFSVLRCGKSILPDFFLHQVCSPFFVNQCMARTTGGHYPAINDANLKQAEIILPPEAEQRRLVAYLDGLAGQVARLQRLQTETAAELDALLPSILDRAFKGEL